MLANGLFNVAYFRIQKFFQENNIKYYPTSVSKTYCDLFNREALGCLSFFYKSEQYYMYFNTAYDSGKHLMVFTSISVISKKNLSARLANLDSKVHINNIEDVSDYISNLRKDMV